jgi:hypothetical protein
MVALRKILSICFVISSVLVSGCFDSYEKGDRWINVDPFTNIKLHSVFAVTLIQGNSYNVELIGDKDVIQDVQVNVTDGELELTDNSRYKWTAPESTHIEVKITAPSFHTVIAEQSYSLSNVGALQIDEFYLWNYPEVKISDINLSVKGKYLFYWNNWLAGGKLIIQGSVDTFHASNYALHIINASELQTKATTLHSYGRENCSVNVSEHFEYSLKGPGDIILYGNPAEVILLERTSTGKLITGN